MDKKEHQHTFRFSKKLLLWLKKRAQKNNRSLSGEIVQILEERKQQETAKHMA